MGKVICFAGSVEAPDSTGNLRRLKVSRGFCVNDFTSARVC